MSQVSQCPSGIVNTTAYIIGMWRDVSSSFGTLFSDAITACFCDYMQSMTVMPRQDSPLSILKRSAPDSGVVTSAGIKGPGRRS